MWLLARSAVALPIIAYAALLYVLGAAVHVAITGRGAR